MSRSIILFLILVPLIVPGCASMFHSGPRDVEISAPRETSFESSEGKSLPIKPYGSVVNVTPPRGADSIVAIYRGKSYVVYLYKSMTGWLALNYFNDGLGLGIDDLTQSWFNYDPVTIMPDSNRLRIYSDGNLQGA